MSDPIPFGRPAAPSPPAFSRVAIIGLGLIGGSVAFATKRAWPSSLVIGIDDKDVVERAMVAQAIDVGGDDLGLAGDAQLVVLAAPLAENERLVSTELARFIEREAVVTDVGSVKRRIIVAARGLPLRLAFVGGHPMAGAAVAGFEHARADLFSGRPWMLFPMADGELHGVDDFVRGLGASPHASDVEVHDRLVAFLSHLPQLTACALMAIVGEAVHEDGLALSGRGLQDTTRLASSPAGMWKEICAANADEIGPALDRLIDLLREVRQDLSTGEVIDRVFSTAQQWKQRMPR
jgi:prephenate dehydrogenase